MEYLPGGHTLSRQEANLHVDRREILVCIILSLHRETDAFMILWHTTYRVFLSRMLRFSIRRAYFRHVQAFGAKESNSPGTQGLTSKHLRLLLLINYIILEISTSTKTS